MTIMCSEDFCKGRLLFTGALPLSPTTTSSLLYPFGNSLIDSNIVSGDCNNGQVLLTIAPGFPFMNKVQTKLYVSYLEIDRLTEN
jgi:hypothetical protein